MTIHRCTVEAGWAGIAEALSQALAGDQVLIASGRYVGDTTLRIPSGVRVTGEQGVVFELAGQDAAVFIGDAEGVELEGIEIHCSEPAVAPELVRDDVLVESGGYAGDTTLRIPSDPWVTGEHGAVFELAGQDASTDIGDGEGVELSGIEFHYSASAVARGAVAGDNDQVVFQICA